MKRLALIIILFVVVAFTGQDNVLSRFKIPDGFQHKQNAPGSFAWWLNHLPLKPAGTQVMNYRGGVGRTDAYTAAVVDMSLGKHDLQQCADAVMRLRAEYLYQQKRYGDIAFHFSSGFNCDYLHYAKGYRYVNGKWLLKSTANYSYPAFLNYMNLVFTYAGTLSLEKELIAVEHPEDIKAGDIFIHGGSPGHCFIVMDVVENAEHQQQFLLAQSFMPAQDTQLLQQNGNAWFSLVSPAIIPYGELVNSRYLRRFKGE